jgi:aspartyl-tRNA(Asn)/glutamyl-tRNA(Gln) amidotransferase subunit A
MTFDPLSSDHFFIMSDELGLSLDKTEIDTLHPQINQLLNSLDILNSEKTPAPNPLSTSTSSNDPHNAFITKFNEFPNPIKGRLSGIKVAVKDNISIKGHLLTAGSAILSNCISPTTAPLVNRLISSGAVISGKTNMDEFAFGPTGETSYFGPTLNPVNPDYTPGGSSSGSGAAVASNMSEVAIGTDTGGSVRIPASYCGIIGLKPTQGVISTQGIVELSHSFDTVGILSSNMDHLKMTLNVISDHRQISPNIPLINLKDLNIGLPDSLYSSPVDPILSKHVTGMLNQIEDSGSNISNLKFPPMGLFSPVWRTITMGEVYEYFLKNILPYSPNLKTSMFSSISLEKLNLLSTSLKQYLIIGSHIMSSDNGSLYNKALQDRDSIRNSINDLFNEFDFLVTPTTPTTAFKFGKFSRHSSPPINYNTSPFNLSGHPAISIPGGFIKGLPVGVQIIAPYGSDYQLIELAKMFSDIIS